MATRRFGDASDNERQESFIHIKELPWLANQEDIKRFFSGLSVKKGGILTRQYDAFVAFEDPHDIEIAMNRKNKFLLGTKVQLSVINKAELRNALFRIARRKLNFNDELSSDKNLGVKGDLSRRKKIRPTPVIRGKKRKIEPCSIFCPKESDIPAPEFNTDITVLSWVYDNEYFPCKKKKIHPIKLSDNVNLENFSIFHPEKCYEFQKMLMNV